MAAPTKKKPDPGKWNELGSPKPKPKTTQKPEKEQVNSKKPVDPLSKFYTDRTIFKGMSWLIYGDSDDGKTYLLSSAANLGRLDIIDTETRALDTRDLEFPETKYPIKIVEPVVFRHIDNISDDNDPIDLEATFNNMYEFAVTYATEVDKGNIPPGSFIGIESMTDMWDWVQSAGKQRQASIKKKEVEELGDDIEWSSIKDKHMKFVLVLNRLRTKGINIIYTARRGDVDANAKSREIRSEKNLPYHVQNHIKVQTETVDGEKIKYCIIERLMTHSTYERVDWPTFGDLMERAEKTIEDTRAKTPKKSKPKGK